MKMKMNREKKNTTEKFLFTVSSINHVYIEISNKHYHYYYGKQIKHKIFHTPINSVLKSNF